MYRIYLAVVQARENVYNMITMQFIEFIEFR